MVGIDSAQKSTIETLVRRYISIKMEEIKNYFEVRPQFLAFPVRQNTEIFGQLFGQIEIFDDVATCI